LGNGLVLSVNIKGALLTGELMTETELGLSEVFFGDFLDDLGEVSSNSSHEFNDGVVVRSSDASGFEDLFTESGVGDTKLELLFLGGLSGGQVLGQKVLEGVGNLAVHVGHDVLEGLLGSAEGLVSSQADHLGEAFQGGNGLLDLGKGATSGVVLGDLEEAQTGSSLK